VAETALSLISAQFPCLLKVPLLVTTGVFSSGCHKTFISCVEQYLKSSSQGFSKLCPYEKIIPVMKQGIEMTMAFTGGMSNEL